MQFTVALVLALPLFSCASRFHTVSRLRSSPQRGYLIASFPQLRQVNYARLPDVSWRPLLRGIQSPQCLCIDRERARLFVADPSVAVVFWYQLSWLPDGRLITDGYQRVAVTDFLARSLAVDSSGTLYTSGEVRGDGTEGIFRLTSQDVLVRLWPVHGAAGLALDAVRVYWASNDSIVEAAVAGAPELLVNRSAAALVLAPAGVFYTAEDGIYGLPLTGGSEALVAQVEDATSLAWDGDSTMLVASRAGGKVFAFAAGTVAEHPLESVTAAKGIYGMALLPEDGTQAGGIAGTVLLMVAALVDWRL